MKETEDTKKQLAANLEVTILSEDLKGALYVIIAQLYCSTFFFSQLNITHGTKQNSNRANSTECYQMMINSHTGDNGRT